MEPVSPVLGEEFKAFEKLYAKDQPEYLALPTLRREADGLVLSRWRLTPEERQALVNGEDLFVFAWTFKQPLQPMMFVAGAGPMEIMAMAEMLGIVELPTSRG